MKEYSTRNYIISSVVEEVPHKKKRGNGNKSVQPEKEATHPTLIRRENANEKTRQEREDEVNTSRPAPYEVC